MTWRPAATLVAVMMSTACSAVVESSADDGAPAEPSSAAASTDAATATTTATTTTATMSTTTSTTTSAAPPITSTTTTPASTSTTTTPTTTTTTTTTTTPPPDVYDIACALRVLPDETLEDIAALVDDDTVDPETLMAENGLESAALATDQLLDVCVDNGLNDIDGTTRTERNSVVVQREVMAQQEQLNQLFDGYGVRELLVDGLSGPVTRQRLCAFRLAAGLPVTLDDMAVGSEEEQALMAATTLPIPFTSSILSERWVLIEETCQIMFVGVGTERIEFVFPTATGTAGFETRPQNRSDVFKFNPASGNGGWHNSTTFPAAEDNPLNGNMYKPLYFDLGLAIHGANNVPRSPASKGCARLRVADQDALINWLGLGDQNSITYDEGRINLTVNVQGRYPSG